MLTLLVDDAAPRKAKSQWLAAFYLCIPTGYALGYILGGAVAGPLGWRTVFALEAAGMAPFIAFCALAPSITLRGTAEKASSPGMLHAWLYISGGSNLDALLTPLRRLSRPVKLSI